MKKILFVFMLLSNLCLAKETDGYNPEIFENRKWSNFYICKEAMFFMTTSIRNEFNIKVVQKTQEKIQCFEIN